MNEPAFPQNEYSDNEGERGLTKLEYAAIEAMKGILSNPIIVNRFDVNGHPRFDRRAKLRKLAISEAKALLSQLEEEK